MIDQHRLGTKGEQRFGELCADAGLTSNKAGVDLAGWDFIVNFEIDNAQTTWFDRRRTPYSCYVQVKTTWEESKSVRLKLNMAERLAIEAIPSFICVFKVRRNLQFADAYLIHIGDDRLANILKRLRRAQADVNSVPLDKQFISFTPRADERMNLTGIALREAFVAHIGEDLHSYINLKRNQREKAGFKGRPFQMSAVFEGLSDSEMLDTFLGRKTEVPVSSFDVVETRFDIPLRERDPIAAKITIKPAPFDTCSISIRRGDRNWPIVFAAEMFGAPKVGGMRRTLIRSELFVVVMDRYAGGGGKIRFEFLIEGKMGTASEWADYYRMLSVLHSGRGVIEIKPGLMAAPLTFQINIEDSSGIDEQLDPDDCVQVIDCLSNIIRHAGVRPEPTFEYGDILAQANGILVLSAMIDAKAPAVMLTIRDPSTDLLDGVRIGPTILVAALSVGSTTFAFYATANVETKDDGAGLSSISFGDFQPKRVQVIEAAEKARELFAINAQRTEGIEQVLWL